VARPARWIRVLRSLSSLLPLLLLLALAGFSWWVAKEAMRASAGSGDAVAAPQTPDYFLFDFHSRSFDAQGRPTAQLSGAAMQHIPGDDTVRISRPDLRMLNAQGVLIVAQADSGISNADGSNVQLIGSALMRRSVPGQPALGVSSSFLNVFPNQQRVMSDRPSVVQRGDSVFSGDSLEVDGLHGTFAMRGHVSASVARPQP
jgi:lipopolysaccharide export system protein LptC